MKNANHPHPSPSATPSPLKGEGDSACEVSPISPLPSPLSPLTPHTSHLTPRTALRKCLVTGEGHDKADLLRFVRAPDGTLTFDLHQKLPGRGAYVVPNADALKTALKKNLFAKSFKDKTTVPPGLAAEIIRQIEAALRQLLAMARRAGDIAAGAEKAAEFAAKFSVGAAILASDAGADGTALAKKLAGNAPMLTLFDRAALGQIFGREQAVVVVMRPGGLQKRLLSLYGRWTALKGLEKSGEIA